MNIDRPTQIDLKLEEDSIWSVEDERAFLACLMADPNLISEADRLVVPHDIHFEMYRYVYLVMLHLYKSSYDNIGSLSFDSVSMINAAKAAGVGDQFNKLTDNGKVVFGLESLASQISPAGFNNFIRNIKDRSSRVEAFRKARAIQQELLDIPNNPSVEKVVSDAAITLADVGVRIRPDSTDGKIIKLSDTNEELWAAANLTKKYSDLNLYHSPIDGFPFWMNLMGGGFERGGLTFIGARAKTGKSLLLMYLANQYCNAGYPVLYIDNEMSQREMALRRNSMITGIASNDFRVGSIFDSNGNNPLVSKCFAQTAQDRFYYCQAGMLGREGIRNIIREFHYKHVGTFHKEWDGKSYRFSKPALIIFDWIKVPQEGGREQEHQKIGYLASLLKDCAREVDIPIIAAGQNNRNALGRSPQDFINEPENMVAGSDRISHFCSQFCLLRNLQPEEMQRFHESPWGQVRYSDGTLRPLKGGVVEQSQNPCPERIDLPGKTPFSNPGKHSTLYNQYLHISLGRNHNDYRIGIPLYQNSGCGQYEEISSFNGTATDMEIQQIRSILLGQESKELF